MLGSTFYHNLQRKYISMFGNLFNDIYVRRVNAEGTRMQTIPVPIRYSKKSRWMEQLATNPQDRKIALHLPFIAFEKTNISHDNMRQTNPLNRVKRQSTSDKYRMFSTFGLIPYKMEIAMTIVAKNQDDLCQIQEQIIPYFTPDHVNTITLVPELDLKMDIPVRLVSVSEEDTYEGTFNSDSRTQRCTMVFELDIYFVGPVSNTGVIKRVQMDFYSGLNNPSRDERVIITPGLTLDGKPTSIREESIPYQEIEAMDDYGFVEEEFTFLDGKIYDPESGKDI